MSNPKEWPLGQRVCYSALLVREHAPGGKRTWEKVEVEPRNGVYIGWRTLTDGTMYYGEIWDDDPGGYIAKSAYPAALVVFDARCKPVLVPFDALEARHA